MHMDLILFIGFAAGTLCTLAYLPQALHSFRTKSVSDLSLAMLVSLNIGLVLWVAYGVLIHSWPIILPNGVTFFLAFPLLVMKLRFCEKRTQASASTRTIAAAGSQTVQPR